MTTSPLSDAEIEELKALKSRWHLMLRDGAHQWDKRIDDDYSGAAREATPRLIAEIEAARKWQRDLDAIADNPHSTISQREFIDTTGGPESEGPFDAEALRLTLLASTTVRALEAAKPGCSETNNIGLLGSIRRSLIEASERSYVAPPPGEGEIEALADRISKAKSLVIWETVYSPYNLHTAYVDQREPLSDRDFNLIISALRRLTQPQNAAAGEDERCPHCSKVRRPGFQCCQGGY